METDNDLNITGRIDTTDEVLELIRYSIKNLERELSKYDNIKDDVNLESISFSVVSEFTHQMVKAGIKSDIIPKTTIKNRPIIQREGLSWVEKTEATKKEWAKFRAFYIRWAKNLIAELNKAKMLNKWVWLDVKDLVQHLTALELEEMLNL